jgi:hypothetical protein
VDANRVENGTGGAPAAMSYGGEGKELLAARAAAWRTWGGQQEELRWWASSGATRGVALEQERALGGAARGPAAALSHGSGEGRGGRRRGWC